MKRSRIGALRRGTTLLFALGLAVGVGAYCSLDGDAGRARAQPGPEVAASDERWVAIIDAARQARGATPAVKDELLQNLIDSDAVPWPDCRAFPANFHTSGAVNAPAGRISVLHFFDADTPGIEPQYYVVLDWDEPLGHCDQRLQSFVSMARENQDRINAHICDQMRLAAEARPLTDPTFRTPSPAVALAYLDAFCAEGGPAAPGGPPDDPGPPAG